MKYNKLIKELMGKNMWVHIKSIFIKELVDNSRDRKSLVQSLLIPLLIGLLYAGSSPLLQSLFNARTEKQSIRQVIIPAIGVDNVSLELEGYLTEYGISLNEYEKGLDSLETAIKEGDERIGLLIPEGFEESVLNEDLTEVILLLNTGRYILDTNPSIQRISQALENYNTFLVKQRLLERGIDTQIVTPINIQQTTLTTPGQEARQAASYFLPILVAFVLIQGSMFIAIDVTAGEKERGTFESLFVTPVTDFELLIGKLIAVFIMSMFPLILTFLGYWFTSNALFHLTNANTGGLSLNVAIGVVFASIPLAIVVNIFQMIIAIRTKTFKDAQSSINILMLLLIIPMFIAAILPPESWWHFLLPAYGTGAVVAKLSLDNAFPLFEFGVNFIGSIIITIVGLIIAIWLFNRERILFDF